MKKVIAYFTGTGNSLALAKEIARARDAELVSIAQILRSKGTLSADELGIVFPVYMFRAPHIVMDFLSKIESAPYIYAVATNGGALGSTFEMIGKELAKQGKKLSLGKEIRMPDNYLPFGGAKPVEKQRERFSQASKSIESLIRSIDSRAENIDDTTHWFLKKVLFGPLCSMGYSRIKSSDKAFKVNDSCTSCEICRRVCPVENITMNNGTPQWNGNCEQCFACIQWCPSESIDFGAVTKGKKRYHHPSVSLQELFEQAGNAV